MGESIKEKYMSIRTILDKIIVRPFPPDTETSGGILIPENIQKRPSKATVIAVGKGMKDKPMTIKEGEVIFHVKGAGIEVEHENELLYIMRDTDVLACV